MTNQEKRSIHLNVLPLSNGFHPGGWLREGEDPEAIFDPAFYRRIGELAERGTFDAVFLADSPRLTPDFTFRPPIRTLDPVLILTAVGAVTSHVGLVVTASTTYKDPYSLAREFATLDLLSGGRAGWNVVTTRDEAAAGNFSSVAHPPPEERYARAEEFFDVVRGLWAGWGEDAIVADRANRRFADPERLRPLDHSGKWFQVAGPVSVPPSPQGRPVIFQAGGSPPGVALAARTADAVFASVYDPAVARTSREELRRQAAAAGRDPDRIAFLPALLTVIGGTEAEARERRRQLDELAGPEAVRMLAFGLGTDPELLLELDRPLPDAVVAGLKADGPYRAVASYGSLIERGATIREILEEGGDGVGHRGIVGTPEQVADLIESWVEAGAADGFNIVPDVLPDGLEAFVDHVVPELRARGLFRHEYEGATLRSHLGID
ncbi:MAG: LLM class flavin-dependent oxidoreductase [Solirubrobacterales bacterium]